jgi:hypothetical protein
VLAGAVVVVGTIAVLGGFNDVPVEKLPKIAIGESYTTNEVEVTVLRAELSDSTPVNHFTEDGKQYVIVEVEVTATTDEPTLVASRLVRVLLEGVISPDDGETPDMDELRNGTYPDPLQPGLPTRIAYSWEIDAGRAQVGDQIIIGVYERYDDPNSAVFEDGKTAPVPVVRIVTELEAGS